MAKISNPYILPKNLSLLKDNLKLDDKARYIEKKKGEEDNFNNSDLVKALLQSGQDWINAPETQASLGVFNSPRLSKSTFSLYKSISGFKLILEQPYYAQMTEGKRIGNIPKGIEEPTKEDLLPYLTLISEWKITPPEEEDTPITEENIQNLKTSIRYHACISENIENLRDALLIKKKEQEKEISDSEEEDKEEEIKNSEEDESNEKNNEKEKSDSEDEESKEEEIETSEIELDLSKETELEEKVKKLKEKITRLKEEREKEKGEAAEIPKKLKIIYEKNDEKLKDTVDKHDRLKKEYGSYKDRGFFVKLIDAIYTGLYSIYKAIAYVLKIIWSFLKWLVEPFTPSQLSSKSKNNNNAQKESKPATAELTKNSTLKFSKDSIKSDSTQNQSTDTSIKSNTLKA